MLEIVNSPSGNLLHNSPHVFHTILDKSAVDRPSIGYNGVAMYVPAICEKGPTGLIEIFEGSRGFASLLDEHGKPNAKKYGLPYSGAVIHASMGGTVVLQTIKAPNATHGAFIVNMKVKASSQKQKIGWIFDAEIGTGKGLVYKELTVDINGETKTIKKLIAEDLLDADGGNVKNIPEFKSQFIADTTDKDLIFAKMIDNLSKTLDGTRRDAEVAKRISTYRARWKKVYINPMEITFEGVNIPQAIAKLKKKADAQGIPFNLRGITSWDALNVLVTKIPENSITDALTALEAADPAHPATLELPIMWGMCKGKGKYGNSYRIQFENTKANVDGRPIMQCQLIDTKTGVVIDDSKKSVYINNDFIYGDVPLLLDSAYNSAHFNGDFKIATAKLETYDDLGTLMYEILYKSFGVEKVGTGLDTEFKIKLSGTDASTNISKVVQPVFENGTSYGVAGDDVIRLMKDQLISLAESDDSGLHRLSYVDLTRVANKIGFIKGGGLQDYQFNGGDEGEFKYMKEFDWDFNFEDKKLNERYKGDKEFEMYRDLHGNTKIIHDLFIDAFSGKANPEIRSLYANPADYIIDFGYPEPVKQAMYNFAKSYRDDIQLIFNVRTSAVSLMESIDYKKRLNYSGRNCMWLPGNFEWIDTYSSRSIRVPQSFALIPTLLQHYESGYDQAIAGVYRGALQLVEPGSGRGFGNMTLDEKDELAKVGLNIMSVYQDNRVYLDSQLMNYKLEEVSSLQEFHNNSIINRIIKDLYKTLQVYKHILTSENSVQRVQEVINRELTKYNGKVASLNYVAKFDSSYDKAVGQLSHYLDIQFNNTIKYHHISLTALPIN